MKKCKKLSMDIRQQYECFIASLRWHISNGGHGTKTFIAKNTSVSSSFIGQISKPNATKKATADVQREIAIFLQGSFEKMIRHGANLLGIVTEKFKELDEDRMREIAREEAAQLKNTNTDHTATPPKTNGDIIDFKNPDQVRHHQLLNKFPNTKEALEMNELAVEYVKKDPNAIKELIKYIKYQMSQIEGDGDILGEANTK